MVSLAPFVDSLTCSVLGDGWLFVSLLEGALGILGSLPGLLAVPLLGLMRSWRVVLVRLSFAPFLSSFTEGLDFVFFLSLPEICFAFSVFSLAFFSDAGDLLGDLPGCHIDTFVGVLFTLLAFEDADLDFPFDDPGTGVALASRCLAFGGVFLLLSSLSTLPFMPPFLPLPFASLLELCDCIFFDFEVPGLSVLFVELALEDLLSVLSVLDVCDFFLGVHFLAPGSTVPVVRTNSKFPSSSN